MLENIFKPLNYLAIKWEVKGAISKKKFDFFIPAILALITSVILLGIDIYAYNPLKEIEPNIFKNDFAVLLTGFLQTIPGFYIAALVAIATLTSEVMDRPMSGVAPTEKILETNPDREVEIPLSRRMFLSRLFSYLAFISLILYFFVLTFKYFYSLDIFSTSQFWYELGYVFCLFIICFFMFQLLLLTFLGLYYLGDRVHRN